MQESDIWKELEIEKTKDVKTIKTAYYTKLKQVNPEDDPEGFKKLRSAFEEAVVFAKSEEEEKDRDEYDIWIDEIRNVYENLSRRINRAEWERLFEKEICTSLDTQDMAAERLLVFMMDNYYVPCFVWNMIDDVFGIQSRKKELVERFPSDFINFVSYQIENNSDIEFYSLFEGNLEGNPDQLIKKQSQCFEELYNQLLIKDFDERDFTLMHEWLEEILKMDVSHVYTTVIEEIVAFYEKNYETVKNSFERLVGILGDDFKLFSNHYLLLEAYALGYEVTGQKEISNKLREQLVNETNIDYILSDCVRYYIDAGNEKKAKELAMNYIEKCGNYPALLQYVEKANEELIKLYRREAQEGNEDSAYEVGWIYFQNDQYKECIEYIQPMRPREGSKKEFSYNNLLGRCMVQSKQYDEALPYLMRAHKLILDVKEKSAVGEDEEHMLKREGLILANIALCYYNMSKGYLENSKASNENYRKADEYLLDAIKMIEKAAVVETNMRDKLYFQRYRASFYYDNEMYVNCIDVCDEILTEAPEWFYIHMLRGKAFYEINYPQNVIDDYNYIANMIPNVLDNPNIYIAPLMTYLEYDRFDNAGELFEFAEEKGVNSAAIDLLKLYSELRQDSDSHSITEILEIIDNLADEEDDFTKSQISKLVIFVAYVTKDEDSFITIMEKAIEIYPGCARKVNWLIGDRYERTGDYQSAIKYFNDAAKLEYKQDKIDCCMLQVGKNYWYMDKNDEAYEIYMSVYNRNPRESDVNRRLAEFYLFKFREDRNEETINKALKHANNQFEINTDPELFRLRAEINLEKYNLDESKKDLLYVLEDYPDYTEALRLLERVYRYEGDFENSYKISLKIIDIESDDYYRLKYDNYMRSAMALRKYDDLENVIKNGYKYDREWALERLIRLYYRQGRIDDLMEVAKSAINNGKSDYERFLGYRTVLVVLCEKGFKVNDDIMKKAVREYLSFINNNPDNNQFVYECLANIYFENCGNIKDSIRCWKLVQKLEMDNSKVIRSNLILAGLHAISGKRITARKYYGIFHKHVISQFGNFENWLKEDGYSRIHFYELGLYYYGMKNLEELQKCIDEMANRVVCRNCDKCKCFEYYILKGHLEKLKGNRHEALKAYEIALDSGENQNRLYITRLMKEC